MKKIIIPIIYIFFLLNSTFAYTQEEVDSAKYLAYKWIITSKELNSDFNLDNNITRREMLKVMFNLSWWYVKDSCESKFSDLKSDDWWCKYAETALKNWMIAKNINFRPNDMITKAEALKMIFKWIWLKKEGSYSSWEEWYVKTALNKWLIDNSFNDYKTNAKRWWIFVIWKNSFFLWNDEDLDIFDFFINN